MNTLIGLAVITILITLAIAAYMLPTLIAWLRRAPDRATVTVINVLLGWTAAGWIVAFALAVRSPVSPAVQVISQVMVPSSGEPANRYHWGPHHARDAFGRGSGPADPHDTAG
jgi:hypothetical protein